MAALWKLPVVYVIENNKYGMGTSIERASARTDLYHRGQAYGIPAHAGRRHGRVEVREAGAKAVAHARSGKGPYILEMLTYRYRGHSMSDPAKYRSKEEVQKVRQEQDPIEGLKQRMLEQGAIGEDELKAIDKEVKALVSESAEFAQNSPEPDPSELYTDVYQTPP